jgi:hypothetical protein
MLASTIMFVVFAAVLAAPLIGLLLLRYLLASEAKDDGSSAPVPLHAMMWRHFLRVLGESPRLLTYRRDGRGRFKNVRR